jgi:deoxyribose-phosphate aldolase
MNYLDYACYDYSINETDVEKNLSTAIHNNILNVSVLPYSINTAKNIANTKGQKLSISAPADFPNGLSDPKTRNFMVSQLCKAGVQYIDLVIPTKIVTNRKYDKFREDIRTNLDICNEHSVELRYILEYRIYSHEVLAKICQILYDFGIKSIMPSSGMMIDDINDNLIACNFLNTKSKIQTIATGNLYTEKQANSLKQMTDLYGMRFFHINSLLLYLK